MQASRRSHHRDYDASCAWSEAGLYESQNAVLHLIRHTVATRLLTGGVDLETTGDVLGHADVSTTALYLHSSDQRKKAAAAKLAM